MEGRQEAAGGGAAGGLQVLEEGRQAAEGGTSAPCAAIWGRRARGMRARMAAGEWEREKSR